MLHLLVCFIDDLYIAVVPENLARISHSVSVRSVFWWFCGCKTFQGVPAQRLGRQFGAGPLTPREAALSEAMAMACLVRFS